MHIVHTYGGRTCREHNARHTQCRPQKCTALVAQRWGRLVTDSKKKKNDLVKFLPPSGRERRTRTSRGEGVAVADLSWPRTRRWCRTPPVFPLQGVLPKRSEAKGQARSFARGHTTIKFQPRLTSGMVCELLGEIYVHAQIDASACQTR